MCLAQAFPPNKYLYTKERDFLWLKLYTCTLKNLTANVAYWRQLVGTTTYRASGLESGNQSLATTLTSEALNLFASVSPSVKVGNLPPRVVVRIE